MKIMAVNSPTEYTALSMVPLEEAYSSEGMDLRFHPNEKQYGEKNAQPHETASWTFAQGDGETLELPNLLTNRGQQKSGLWSRRRPTCELKTFVVNSGQRDSSQQLLAEPEICDRYELQHVIGSGSMATVHHAIIRSNRKHVALKVLKGTSDMEKMALARQEFELLKQLPMHQHIINAIDLHEVAGCGPILVLELFEGMNLQAATKAAPQGRLSLSQAQTVGIALFSAVAHLHTHKVLHRDIKPQNILVKPCVSDLRLTDFNMARVDRDGEALTPVGDLIYRSPEVIAGEPCSACSDIWQSGLCVLFAFIGMLPHHPRFESSNTKDAREDWNPKSILQHHGAPKVFEDSLCRALQVEANKRAIAEELSLERAWRK